MKYTRIEKAGDNSIEHIVEGDYSRCSLRPHEEVLAIFTEMNAKDAVEYQWQDVIRETDPNTTRVI